MNLLEAEPAAAPGPDIPALRELLAILVSTRKCKDAIGVNLTHEQVRRLEDKDVIRHHKRYGTYVGAKTTETLIESLLSFATRTLGMVVRIKDSDAMQNELKNDYIVTKELSTLTGGLALRCGRTLAVANAFLITVKHVYFSSGEVTRESPETVNSSQQVTTLFRWPKQKRVAAAEQSSVNAE